MIDGIKPRPVARYLCIDHCGDGVGWTTPKEGQVFTGIPHSYYGDLSLPFIEISKDGVVTRTVNTLDIAEIDFAESTDG